MLRCHTGACSYVDLRREVGLPVGAESRNADTPTSYDPRYLVATYTSREGKPLRRYRRDWPKDFPDVEDVCPWPKCETPAVRHKHTYGSGSPKGAHLLAWDTVKPESKLVICEGEKAAAALDVDGYVAVSYPNGAGSAGVADYSLCINKVVYVWPDDDSAGEAAGKVVAAKAKLAGATEVRMVWHLDSIGNGDDAADCPPVLQAQLLANATLLSIQGTHHEPAMQDDYPAAVIENQSGPGDALRLLAFAAPRLVLVYVEHAAERRYEPYIRLPNGLLDKGAGLQMELLASTDFAIAQAKNVIPSTRELNAAVRYLNRIFTPAGMSLLNHAIPAAIGKIGPERLIAEGARIVDARDVGLSMRYAAFANGIVDKRTGEMVGSVDEDVYIIGNCRWNYKPDATHPDVDRVMPPLEEVQDEQQKWWREVRGVMSHRPPEREIVTQISEPGSGKSTWRSGDLAALAPYVTTMREEGLQHQIGGASKHNGDLVALAQPAWWCYLPEVKKVDAEQLNQVSGGDGYLSIRRIHREDELIYVTAHLVIQGNGKQDGKSMLGLGAADQVADALADRVKPMIMHTIRNPEKRLVSAMLGDRARCEAWIARTIKDSVQAWGKYGNEETGHIAWPDASDDQQKELDRLKRAEATDWEREFLLTRYETGQASTDIIKMSDVLREYEQWHKEEYGSNPKMMPVSRKMLTTRLKKHLGAESRSTGHDMLVWPVCRKAIVVEEEAEHSPERRADDRAEIAAKRELEAEHDKQMGHRAAEDVPEEEKWMH